MKINFNNNLLILVSLIFFIKPLEYLAANLFIANFAEDLIYPLFFHLIIYIFFILSFFICLKLNNVTLNKFFVALAASYYLQYYFLDINEFTQLILPRISNNFITYLISITFILIASIFFLLNFFHQITKDFLVFTLLLCISQIGVMSINFINSFAYKDQRSNKENYSSEIKLQKIKEVKGENIYYIVLDGMTSYKYIVDESKIENSLYNQFNKNLKKQKFKVLNNSFSSYNTTYLTLASIFNLDYFDENYVYKNRNDFFPQMLYKKNPPKLIQNLAYLDYEFNYHGNMWAGCKKSLHFSCSQNQSINPTANNFIYKLSTYFNNSGIVVFTQKSFIGLMIRKFILIHNPMSKQDGLDNFLYNEIYSIKPYSKNFILFITSHHTLHIQIKIASLIRLEMSLGG